MIRKWLFYVIVASIGFVLLFYSQIKEDKNYAVIAEVESQKTAISFHKPVKIKELHVQAGAKVKKGDLLLVVERADLDLEVEKAQNELTQVDNQLRELEVKHQSNLQLQKLNSNKKITELDLEIFAQREKLRKDSIFYSKMLNKKASQQTAIVEKDINLESLILDRKMVSQAATADFQRLQSVYKTEKDLLLLKKNRTETELKALLIEQQNLRQYAPFDGTIGSVSVQLMELVSPFQTIISVYEQHPDIIKGYINELAKIEAVVGEKVLVSSDSRPYKISGEVVEVGSRIVSLPKQMNPMSQIPLWGKEVFVKIPKKNEFLNGEKVYVLFEKK